MAMAPDHLHEILATADRRIRLALLEAYRRIDNAFTVAELTRLIEAGQIEQAYETVNEYLDWFAKQITIQYILAGQATAEYIHSVLNIGISFNQVNERAVQIMRTNELRLLSNFSTEQRAVVRAALVDGVYRGINPKQQAELFKRVVGLSNQQVNAVISYRQLLKSGSRDALSRALRDRRFDSSVENIARIQKPLTDEQIDRMVQRYIERSIAHRARVIARTEALRAVNEGSQMMYAQAIAAGTLNPDQLTQQWNTARDLRVRDSHQPMNGQKQKYGTPFVSGSGNLLAYPGDPNAPAKETILCRCVLSTRLTIGD